MRKFMFGLLATLFVVAFAAVPASAEYQENAPEKDPDQVHTTTTPVECTFHNFTYASNPEEWAYYVGDEIDFEVTLSDPDNTVANIIFFAEINQKGGPIGEGLSRSTTWTAPAAGEWKIFVELFDVDNREIIPTGDCDGAVTVFEYTEPAHPDHPDEEFPPAEENACANVDPSTLVPVPEEDGSTSYYTPEGAFCGTILGTAPTAPEPVPNNDPTPSVAAQQSAAPQAAELARTGTGLTITAIVGFMLLVTGFFALYVRRFALNLLPAKR